MPGKSAPDTLPAGLGRSGRVKGPCPRPYGAAGRTNPLTRPSLKTRQRPAQGLGGALPEWMGVKARAATAQRLGLDAQERPPRLGWWLGCFSPAACHVANAPGGPPEALLICSCFARFRETTKRAFRMRKDLSTDLRSSRKCALRCFERAHFAVSNVRTSLFRTCTLRCFERALRSNV